VNTGKDEKMKSATLYYEEQYWGNLGFGDPPLAVNTYEGHTWNIKVGDEVVETMIISETKGESQFFEI
jgi:hypothetical protein